MANFFKGWPILKRLLTYGIRWKKLFLLAFFFLLIASISEILGPVLISYFLNNILTQHNLNKKIILIIFTTFIILQNISIILNYFQMLIFNRIAIKIVEKIRSEVMESALLQPLQNFHAQPIGKITSKITNDTEAIKELYDTVLNTIFRSLSLIFIMSITMLIMQWKMALVSMTLFPLVIIVICIYQYYSTPILRTIRSYLAKINNEFNEIINGMLIIQQFVQQSRFKKSIENTSKLNYNEKMKILKIDGLLLRPLLNLFSSIVLCELITLFSLSPVGAFTVGILYAFISYLNRLNEPLISITTQQSILQQSLVAGERIFKLIDSKKQQYGYDLKPLKTGNIQISNLNFSYQKKSPIILKNINLNIPSKSFTALIGHTGSGKSTLANLIMGYYPKYQGSIIIDQRPLKQLSYHALRNGIYMVQQEPTIFTGTILSNITLGKKISEKKVWTILKKTKLHSFFKSMSDGLNTTLLQSSHHLSSGQKQLISIARILILNPKILILDEATSNIDPETEQSIQNILLSIKKYSTLIIIAHRLSTIINADNIVVLQQGKIIEQGNHKKLIQKKGIYYDMYHS
ncbi:SmdB family multidrug efflux ABC transporter permease/ATP-binding protein [Buchnera aphidicola]|uniref:Multidrug resistance-like ATP-binding protein MdlB n=1 Tax=Buchnera aphidicola (Stegophylla sp.) TaxID=2315800 RepID=A0A4D6YKF8_9GAMM|nr:SmdB family multidrug efflux ABC transporter permease/ATP-binding protein [Buchnera aphidicola (Stegophylla sp.)]QCI26454.1 SmdB family multidrug efflux ABC transporter permease/ATP-binding protein [Buchnera aphidicola (Stegophylla sp.)]